MNTEDQRNRPLCRIACAALRHPSGLILAGVRHFSPDMRAMIARLEQTGITPESWNSAQQGFLDNKGLFLSREQAWRIAEAAGQIRPHPSVRPGTLHSEDLY